ncbi:FtsX-like permease family protein [Nocardioides sp. zg-579]|uniref:FtsX-like permease family protein n=1 Tax=Nocardioides marmotae TaxID=2663857 RepID=A0A6I3JEN3_9ACTN|nr:FtsX-like permease family protein [Nocardioides marmotae]MCR6033014.1 FtsX-like permease family protein [Gordonia jinghuaiqii]MTB96666.1 FtsX-like permease family protein [Nocardioides marmotae]QKE03116.1 FtsX-like permease family protein [Nocardioides marmotae]
MSWAAGWRPALRIARREARRARARTALVLVMIALPVLAVTAAAVVIATEDVGGTEAIERRIGAADARVDIKRGARSADQAPDPDDVASWSTGGRGAPTPGVAEMEQALGRDVPALPWRQARLAVTTERGVLDAEASEVDLADPLAEGLFRLEDGRLPRAADEVVVNRALAERGFGLGEQVELADGGRFEVVGLGESTSWRTSPVLVGPGPGLVGSRAETTSWLVGGGPVTWSDVRALNGLGALVVSRAVLEDPPPASAVPEEIGYPGGTDDVWLAIVALVAVMVLIEVVLLAGPAFAVGARRQARTLALLAASGGTPRQARRVVLAGGLVLGGLGAVVGVGLGLGAGALAARVLQSYSDQWLGPFDVPWLQVGGVAAFGLVSALLAAVVPAWLASRQDVVAVLAGRRGDPKPSLRSPLLGVVLLGLGAAGSAFGALQGPGGELLIAGSAIPTVLGMVLLVPVVLAALARVSRGLPLVLRYAVRDAARHRTRTVPAVAAVAATVAGVVALGIANASDRAQSEALYSPQLAMGDGIVRGPLTSDADWRRVQQRVESEVAGAVRPARGVSEVVEGDLYRDVAVRASGGGSLLSAYGGVAGTSLLVDDTVPAFVAQALAPGELDRAEAALAAGRAAVLTDRRTVRAESVRLRVVEHPMAGGRGRVVTRAELPAAFVRVRGFDAPVQAVVPPVLAERAGVEVGTVSLQVEGPVSEDVQRDVDEAVAGIDPDLDLYVERGFAADDDTWILMVVLGALGGLLMLGGTLTATSLALSDARPDLATLAAVGAAPRTRRAVAAAYALVVGLVGAVLGAVVGAVPGVAAAYPLTSNEWSGYGPGGDALPDHFLAVPWLLVAVIVVGLPLLSAGLVALTSRSRLPLAARLD